MEIVMKKDHQIGNQFFKKGEKLEFEDHTARQFIAEGIAEIPGSQLLLAEKTAFAPEKGK